MNKSYNFIADKIEVRSSLVDSSNPKYIVKGYAQIPNKKDIYRRDYKDRSTGKVKLFRSMFTDDCIKSLKKQAKYKKIFVDSMHELAVNANVQSIVKDKVSDEEFSKIKTYLRTKTLPFAKIDNIEIDDKGLFVETSLNPAFREVDEDHRRYFDAVWSSLQNHYINGLSTTIIPTDVLGKDEDLQINDADLCGISYIDQPALIENNITEVAMRAALDYRAGEEQMAEEKLKEKEAEIKQEKEKLEAEKKTLEEEKAKIAKDKEDAEKTDLEKQKEEQEKIQEDLDKKLEDVKKREEALGKGGNTAIDTPPAESGKPQGEVKPQDKYGEAAKGEKKTYDEKFYKEQVAEITKEHDESVKAKGEVLLDNRMKGFGEMVNLAAKSRDPTLSLDEADRRYIADNPALLSAGRADINARPRP